LRTFTTGAQFRPDVKLAQRRGKDMAKREIILLLVEGKSLPARYKDHPLSGPWTDYRDCHIEPDWLLIYKSTATTYTWSARARIPISSNCGDRPYFPNSASNAATLRRRRQWRSAPENWAAM
jgi:mRNA interferase YafQ